MRCGNLFAERLNISVSSALLSDGYFEELLAVKTSVKLYGQVSAAPS